MKLIDLKNVCLDYPLVRMGNRSLKTQILGAATGGRISTAHSVSVIEALRDISFFLQDGDRLGLVGHNGAGKSTLLKVLAGIYLPSSGSLEIKGKVVSTLNISLGMQQEATGFENIISRGLLLGMKRSEINAKLEGIASFTELGEYLNLPIRVYSAGMATRLAFATVTAMDADVLLMDEVIGTGDANFISKAEDRLNNFMNRSKIIVLASHSNQIIQKFCNKALLLEKGRIIAMGPTSEIIETYQRRSVELNCP